MASLDASAKRMSEDDEMTSVNATLKARIDSKQHLGRVRRDYSLPTTTVQQLPLLEAALNAATSDQGLPDVILDLVGGRVPAQAPDTSSSDATTGTAPVAAPFVTAFKNVADAKTAKGGAAFQSTGSALVDLDFALKPPGDADEIRELLTAAYKDDPSATVKIVFRARSIHEGKGFREGFWIAAGWLMEHHPRTFLENLHLLVEPTCERQRSKTRDAARPPTAADAEDMGVETLDEEGTVEGNVANLPEYPARPHGTYDDLDDLLLLALNGQLSGSYSGSPTAPDEIAAPAKHHGAFEQDRKRRKGETGARRDHTPFKQLGVAAKKLDPNSFEWKLLKAGTRQVKGDLYAQRLFEALNGDKKFQALFLTVTYLFVKQLKADAALLDRHNDFLKLPADQRAPFGKGSSPHLFGMSFAAKWVSSPGHSADKQTYIASAIGHLLFPGDGFNIARTHLQQRYLTPLRSVLSVPETKMKQGEWKINYSKVPGRCMARNATHFMAHDPAGFEAFLKKVASGRSTISGASLLPHEIVMDACGDNLIASHVADLQWRSMVDAIISSGSKLDNCLAIADVSGSMGSYLSGDKKRPQPINVCIALTLLLGEVATDPWRGMFFTFSEVPCAAFIDMSLPIRERAIKLQQADWGQSTNFHTVFELILAKAQEEQLAPDQMVSTLFVFSDMQFDAAGGKQQGDTEYAAIRRKFEKAGYVMPELVFWNLSAGDKTPVPVKGDQEGVSLMSGFSGAQVKYFLSAKGVKEEDDWVMANEDEDDVAEGTLSAEAEAKPKGEKKRDSPIETLRKVLAAESFKGIKIYD